MLRFIIRRVIIIIPMLFIIVSLTWALIRLAPGNFYTGEKKLAPAIEQNLREKYGLNKPWHVQYRKVLWNIARFDFGNSLRYEGQSVNQILWRALPISATLGFCAWPTACAHFLANALLVATCFVEWICEQESNSAGINSLCDLHRIYRTVNPFGDAGSNAIRLHPHRACERADRKSSRHTTRPPRRATTRRFIFGTGSGFSNYRNRRG